jgi:hypothetical protein
VEEDRSITASPYPPIATSNPPQKSSDDDRLRQPWPIVAADANISLHSYMAWLLS